ncbi:M10 family metallopeptidase C-terminal domain-containing protein [Labrenzia sp. VG12]|uniref:M10 family metallopeptidase C-terminal domain-containing protein n=1 Tax=Labrenzia sp. VG12 TaxID=2021862 RepID=UPI000B8BDD1C|nr:hypothetical protein [Labrenzia sp. VG12]ASP35880.1 hypothetical protein CHH27_23710 [Labrenzia sp. VG12]
MAGNDTLDGGLGDDVLTGGDGQDVFLFRDNSDTDIITDFEDGRDTIAIDFGTIAFSDLNIFERNTETVVAYDSKEIILENFNYALLSENDFLFL